MKTPEPTPYTDRLRKEMGDCPICGGKFWFNDIPLKAHCWGSLEKEHKEYSVLVPEDIVKGHCCGIEKKHETYSIEVPKKILKKVNSK